MSSSRFFGVLLGIFVSSPSFAVDIFSVPQARGNWSDPALWVGGLVPGMNDAGYIANQSTVTVDINAPAVIGGASMNGTAFTLARPATFGGIGLRESNLIDGGFDLLVLDVLSNSGHTGGGSFNGGSLTRQGGRMDIGHLDLGRVASDMTFRPGDIIRGDYTTSRLFNAWPNISVVQDEMFYDNNLGEGLSFEDPNATISLGHTNAGDQSSITLSWDQDLTGQIDWTMRWRGDHVAQMTTWYNDGQIIIGTTPAGQVFDASNHIFYDAISDYTYVGFYSTDGDGVCQVTDRGFGPDRDCAPIGFSGLFPALAGQNNGYVAWDLDPTARYFVLASDSGGTTPIPGCPGIFANLGSPRVLRQGQGQVGGVDAQRFMVPAPLGGVQVLVQIVELDTCRKSEAVVHDL